MIDRRLRRALSLTAVLLTLAACSSSDDGSNNNPPDAGNGTWSPGQPLTLNVGGAFPAGTVVRDVSSGTTATVSASGTVAFTPDSSGLRLLERDGAASTPFSWANATVYFLLTERFFNGDPANANGYGTRPKDGATEIGTQKVSGSI